MVSYIHIIPLLQSITAPSLTLELTGCVFFDYRVWVWAMWLAVPFLKLGNYDFPSFTHPLPLSTC